MDFDGYLNPDPVPQPESRPFWEAAAEGRLLIKGCCACGRVHWYPRAICPFCFSPDTEWREAGGGGTIYAFAPMRRAAAPYILAYVTLDEGPTMMTDIVGAAPEALSTGQRVTVVFHPTEGGMRVPLFTPA